MTSQGDGPPEPVDLGKHGDGPVDGAPGAEPDFDPYRFGLPDHPVPPEFAPPGYRQPPQTPPSSYSPYGPDSPYGSPPQGTPYGSPPQGTPYGSPPYPNPYGHPPQAGPGHPGYYPTTKQSNGKAIGSLVCGIVSVVLCWLAFLDFALVIPAFVLGAMVLSNRQSVGRGMALAGLICAVVGSILAVVFTVVYVHIAHECSDVSGNQQQQCIRDKF